MAAVHHLYKWGPTLTLRIDHPQILVTNVPTDIWEENDCGDNDWWHTKVDPDD